MMLKEVINSVFNLPIMLWALLRKKAGSDFTLHLLFGSTFRLQQILVLEDGC